MTAYMTYQCPLYIASLRPSVAGIMVSVRHHRRQNATGREVVTMTPDARPLAGPARVGMAAGLARPAPARECRHARLW